MNLLWWLVIYGAGPGFTPPAGGDGPAATGVGTPKSFSDATEVGGGSW